MHYSLSTEKVYLYWVRFFIRRHGRGGQMKHPRTMGAPEIEAFLTMLATEHKVSTSTHNQALSALLFLYREVLGIDLPWMDGINRPAAGSMASASAPPEIIEPDGFNRAHPSSRNQPATVKMKIMKSTLALLAIAALACNAFAAAPAETLPSGVKIVHTVDGTGAQPTATDTVKVNYRGTLADGKEFDSSYKRGSPATFSLSRVVPCWTEGLQKIRVGGKATLTCPPATAYGERGAGGVVPPNATLTFEVELLAIEK